MKIDFFTAGIDSLELALDHLSQEDDVYLRASILLGFHGVCCLLKAAAKSQGIAVNSGVKFPSVVGALKSKGFIDKADNKALTLLNKLRNAVEHDEVDYDQDKFKIAIHSALPIIEKIIRECTQKNLRDEVSGASWDVLLEIQEFVKHLQECVEEALNKPSDPKDASIDPSEVVRCDACGRDGLPWHGLIETVQCWFCGEKYRLAPCHFCNDAVVVSKRDEWPFAHSECWKDYFDRND